jgi:hypothetical protein
MSNHLSRRCGSVLSRVSLALCVAGSFAAGPVWGTQKFGPIEFSGNLQSQNLIRHPDASSYQFIQNRNTARLRVDWDWLQGGKLMNTYDVPFIQSSKFFLVWRGVYDSVYDFEPQVVAKRDIHERGYGGQTLGEFAESTGRKNSLYLSSLSRGQRDAFRFENNLREMYIDVKLRNIPLTVRAGKQQITWGETDNFRMLDRANALDLTWHFQQEIPAPAFGWDELRQTQWMFKFLYDLGDIAGTSQNFLEWYWNPGDWRPAKQAFLPRPWGLPFQNPLTNPNDGVFLSAQCISQDQNTGRTVQRCQRLMNGTRLFGKGDYSRNPLDNSQVGVRYHTIIPGGIETALVYFYQRFAGDDGTNYAPLKGVLASGDSARDVARLQRIIRRGEFPAEAFTPYVHSLGLSANYSDEEYTQAVFRMETLLDFGIPFFDVSKVTLYDSPALPGVTKKNMWKGMIGFDRPTWIRWLNKKSTWFLTGQFFWHHLIDNPSCQARVGNTIVRGGQAVAQQSPDVRRSSGSCLVGGLDLPSTNRSAEFAFRDKIRDWESLFTLAAFSFYRGGSIVPVLGMAVDPVNQWNMEAFWSVDYIARADLIINLGQRYFIQPRGHSEPIFEA